jgi:hypothetical protein
LFLTIDRVESKPDFDSKKQRNRSTG